MVQYIEEGNYNPRSLEDFLSRPNDIWTNSGAWRSATVNQKFPGFLVVFWNFHRFFFLNTKTYLEIQVKLKSNIDFPR